MNQHRQFIEYHEALMRLSHHPDFIADGRQDKLTALTSLCGHLLNVDRVSVWRLNESGSAIESECLFRLGEGHDFEPMVLDRTQNPAYFRALLRARVIDVPDTRSDERTQGFVEQYLKPLGIQSMLDSPIFDGGDLSGVICLETLTPRVWTLPEMSFVTAVADTISLINSYEAWANSMETLDYIIHYDDLTGLPNLKSFRERISRLIQSDKTTPFALLWIDLDRIKVINDGMGQHVGNQVIHEVANRLRNLLIPGKDKIARCGGDEFVILVRQQVSSLDLDHLADDILQQIADPIAIGEHSIKITASIGISHYPSDATEPSALLKHSEAAMYHAKEKGRARAEFFNTSISADARKRFLLESQLRHAIINQELQVYYQPIVSADKQKLCMLEALVRWNHPTEGVLTPDKFLGLAHSAGIMPDLGENVLRIVCRDVQHALNNNLTMPILSVNLAPEQLLDTHLPERVKAVLDEFGLTGDRFEFELIEDVIKSDSKGLREVLHRLSELGAHLSIDDFGTGYSSLARLKHLPFTKLKIDRSFICDLPDDADDCAITLSILGLARGLGLSVVAEGVETEAQEQWLQEQGCDFLQGYRYSRPIPFDRLLTDYF